MNKHLIWALSLVLITLIICGTLVWINYNSWTVKFEMDDNTKDAIKSLNFTIPDSDYVTNNYWWNYSSDMQDNNPGDIRFRNTSGVRK